MTSSTTMADPVPGDERLSGRAWGVLLVRCGALFLDALDNAGQEGGQ